MPVLAASRLVRWSIFLNAYDYEMQLRNMKNNANADMLSRIPLDATEPASKDEVIFALQVAQLPVRLEDTKKATIDDETLTRVLECLRRDHWSAVDKVTLQPYFIKRNELVIHNDVLLWGMRVVIPCALKRKVLNYTISIRGLYE